MSRGAVLYYRGHAIKLVKDPVLPKDKNARSFIIEPAERSHCIRALGNGVSTIEIHTGKSIYAFSGLIKKGFNNALMVAIVTPIEERIEEDNAENQQSPKPAKPEKPRAPARKDSGN